MKYVSKDGKEINFYKSYYAGNEEALKLAEHAVATIEVNDQEFIKSVVTFNTTVGVENCVETTDSDTIVMAHRHCRNNQTRFVLNRTGVPTDKMTILIKRKKNRYMLVGAYFGNSTPKELTDPTLTDDELQVSSEYWNSHALVFNPAIINIRKSSHVCTYVVQNLNNDNVCYAGSDIKSVHHLLESEIFDCNVQVWLGGQLLATINNNQLKQTLEEFTDSVFDQIQEKIKS